MKENLRPADHEKRLQAAEARSQWELGDKSWAGVILAAYWNPDEDAQALNRDKGEGWQRDHVR